VSTIYSFAHVWLGIAEGLGLSLGVKRRFGVRIRYIDWNDWFF